MYNSVELDRETSCLPNLLHSRKTILYRVSRSKPDQCNHLERSNETYYIVSCKGKDYSEKE